MGQRRNAIYLAQQRWHSVGFDSVFPDVRVVRYDDAEAPAEFGRETTRVVRLAAIKPEFNDPGHFRSYRSEEPAGDPT